MAPCFSQQIATEVLTGQMNETPVTGTYLFPFLGITQTLQHTQPKPEPVVPKRANQAVP